MTFNTTSMHSITGHNPFPTRYSLNDNDKVMTGTPLCKTAIFVERAKEAWGDRFDYSKTMFTNSTTPLTIICREHGEFTQYPHAHINKNMGCDGCKQRKRLTTDVVVQRAKAVWGDRWDYSNTHFVKSKEPISIICRDHGEFHQLQSSHVAGLVGCEECRKQVKHGRKRLTKSEFIKKAQRLWGDRFDYSKVNYTLTTEKVTITCKEHGDFVQRAYNHLNKQCGCIKCATKDRKSRRCTTEQFIEKARDVWFDKFDYSKVNYSLSSKKVVIICREHNSEFEQTPNNHLNGQNGCTVCHCEKKLDQEKYLNRITEVWGNRWDYSKVVFTGLQNPITVICHEHGEFTQSASSHLSHKCGCNECRVMPVYDTAFFIKRAKAVWGDRWDYSKAQYVKTAMKTTIICPIHGQFEQTPHNHLQGICGCPSCKQSNRANRTKA